MLWTSPCSDTYLVGLSYYVPHFLIDYLLLFDHRNRAKYTNTNTFFCWQSLIHHVIPSKMAYFRQQRRGDRLWLIKKFDWFGRWGQVFILDSISTYTPKDEREAQSIIERVTPRLAHANASVVLSSVKVWFLLHTNMTSFCLLTWDCDQNDHRDNFVVFFAMGRGLSGVWCRYRILWYDDIQMIQ